MDMETIKEDAYTRLISILDQEHARYRQVEHAPEGRTEVVSQLRGNELGQAAKCMVVMVKVDKRSKRYCLAVVPGDARVDLNALKTLYGGEYASFAPQEVAEEL